MSRLEEQLRPPAAAWRPEPGDRLIGEIVDLDTRTSRYNDEPYPVVTVRDEATGSDVAFHAFHTVARRDLEALQPRVGQRIGIAYFGEKQSRDGDPYHSYTIRVDDSVPAPFAGDSSPVAPESDDDDVPF